MKALAICLLALLTGCATRPPATVEVRVPVTVPCVKNEPERPQLEFPRLPANASDGDKILALVRDWLRSRKYEEQLEAVIAGCH